MLLNHQVFSEEIDDGTPLVILHGLFGSLTNWRSLGKQFARRFEVHLLDLRNHGQSFWDSQMDYPSMAQDVVQYLNEAVKRPAVVLGHSMGGKVAMQLALTRPELVSQLIVADIAPVNYSHDHADLLAAMHAMPLANITDRREADSWLVTRVAEAPVRQFLLQNLLFETETAPRWRINLAAIEANMSLIFQFPPNSAQFDAATLFLRGDRSEYVEIAHQADIFRLFPEAKIYTIERAGHWLHAEQPKEFMQAVNDFLV